MGLYSVEVRNNVQAKIITKQIIIFFGSDYSFRSELSTSLGENMESRVVCPGTKGVHVL